MGEHLESHGFVKKGESKRDAGRSYQIDETHYEHPHGAKATVSHSPRMSTAKGKSVAGAALEVHSGVKNDEKTPWGPSKK